MGREKDSQSSSLASGSSMRVHSIRDSTPPCCNDYTMSLIMNITDINVHAFICQWILISKCQERE